MNPTFTTLLTTLKSLATLPHIQRTTITFTSSGQGYITLLSNDFLEHQHEFNNFEDALHRAIDLQEPVTYP